MGFGSYSVARFWSKVSVKTKNECWEWNGAKSSCGYGSFSDGGRIYVASRVAWEMVFGRIADGLCVLHKCDNPGCVNFHHLSLGTHKDNMADRESKGRGRTPRNIGEDNRSAKLMESQVAYIRLLINHGFSDARIAEWCCVTRDNILLIRKWNTWKSISPAELHYVEVSKASLSTG